MPSTGNASKTLTRARPSGFAAIRSAVGACLNLPNQITFARLVLTGIFVAVVATGVPWVWSWAAILFIVGSVTDFVDGWLARKYGLVTNFGALMDPLVDKVLTCSAFVLLSVAGVIPSWVACTVLAREFLITGLRTLAATHGAVLSADGWGKWKTGAQIAVLIYGLLQLAALEPPFQWVAPWLQIPLLAPGVLGQILLGLAVFTTVWSGLRYLWNNRHVLTDV
ncbi:MAG: CDP-diacylglycerol--glycerol-3-phosphate 3-phosphatidyltransferase [Verrucomicrobiales bacterium]